jgi:hypothetical protein
MSTRSRVGIETPSGYVRSIYVHFDGYPEGVGRKLLDHWSDEQRINELLDLGDLSGLGSRIGEDRGTGWFDQRAASTMEMSDSERDAILAECLAYGRDRGEKDVGARMHTKDDWPDSGQEWEYLYVPSLRQWLVRNPDWTKWEGPPATPWTSIENAIRIEVIEREAYEASLSKEGSP